MSDRESKQLEELKALAKSITTGSGANTITLIHAAILCGAKVLGSSNLHNNQPVLLVPNEIWNEAILDALNKDLNGE